MRIQVYTLHQQPALEPAAHCASKALALALALHKLVKTLPCGSLQLTTEENWKSIKERLRMVKRPVIPVTRQDWATFSEKLKPEGRPSSLLLSYPPKDDSSYAK